MNLNITLSIIPLYINVQFISNHRLVYYTNCDSSLAGGAMFITSVIIATIIIVTAKGTTNISKILLKIT